MPTFYVGTYAGQKYVLEGDSAASWYNPYKKMVAVYSNWSLWSSHHVLNGAPDENHTPGTGYHPHGLQMSRWFLGLDPAGLPTKNPGLGAFGLGIRQWDGRFRPYEYKGVETLWKRVGTAEDDGIFGHVLRFIDYSWNLNNFYFGAVPKVLQTSELGHVIRAIDANIAGVDGDAQPSSFGYFPPSLYRGLPGRDILNDQGLGETLPLNQDGSQNYNTAYGHNGVNVWQGIPSAKAL